MALEDDYPAYGGHGPSDFSLGLGLGITATVLILLRIYVRLRINKLGTHALIWAIIAWALTVVTQVFGILSVLHGLGNHITIIAEAGQLRQFLTYTWITVFFFNLAIPIGKVAVAVFLIEMDAKTHPKIKWALIGIAIFNVVVNIPQILMVWFQCSPPDALFDPLRQSQCDHTFNVYYTYFVGSVAAVSDIALAIIPAFMLWPLKIDRKLKIALCILMSTGIVAAVAAVIRSVAARHILDKDSSYGVGTLFYWGEVEEWLVIITMSIPPCWPLFKPHLQRFLTTISSSHSGRRNTHTSVLPSHTGEQPKGIFSGLGSHLSSRRGSRGAPLVIGSPQMVRHEFSGDPMNRSKTGGPRMWDAQEQSWVELDEIEKNSVVKDFEHGSHDSSPVEGFSPIETAEPRRVSRNSMVGHAL